MAIDLTGTNTEKIDKLAAYAVETRVTLRIVAGLTFTLLPLVTALAGFLLLQAFQTNARLERLDERVGQVERRMERIEAKLDKLAERKAD